MVSIKATGEWGLLQNIGWQGGAVQQLICLYSGLGLNHKLLVSAPII